MNDAIVTQADRDNDARIDAWKARQIEADPERDELIDALSHPPAQLKAGVQRSLAGVHLTFTGILPAIINNRFLLTDRNTLSNYGFATQAATVEHCIANGWKTLNPIRDHGHAPGGRRKTRYEELTGGRSSATEDDDDPFEP